MHFFVRTGLSENNWWFYIFLNLCPALGTLGIASAEVYDGQAPAMASIPVCSESVVKKMQLIRHHKNPHDILVKAVESLPIPFYWMSSNVTTHYTIVITEPSCRNSSRKHLKLIYEGEVDINSNTSTKNHFYTHGYFRFGSDVYAPDEYCIESFSRLELGIQFCQPNCDRDGNKDRPCIVKCCPLDKLYQGGPSTRGKSKCVSVNGTSIFWPTFWENYNTLINQPENLNEAVSQALSKPSSSHRLPHFIIKDLKVLKSQCPNNMMLMHLTSTEAAQVLEKRFSSSFESIPFRIRKDGTLMYSNVENKCAKLLMEQMFCIDGARGALSSEDESTFTNTEDEYVIFHCPVLEKDSETEKLFSFVFGILLLTTSVFPLVTCCVYIIIWKKQTVHGWTIAATSGSLFFMYIFHGTGHLIGITLSDAALNKSYCQLLAILTHFFTMSTFTWLTVMCCDLWLTFRSVTPMNHRLEGLSRYLKYSAFGWCVPTISVIIGIVMDYGLPTDCSYDVVVPGYGQQSCYVMEDSLGEYVYYPAACLICLNLLLFTATCVKLSRFGHGNTVRARRSKNDCRRECFSRFTKLFFVMGISWISEIVSWHYVGLGYSKYWNILDVFNILRAVGVFAIYVCKKDVVNQLEEVYPILQRVFRFRPFGNLFVRKLSEEINESTVFSGVHSSTVIPLKKMTSTQNEGGDKKMGDTLSIPQ